MRAIERERERERQKERKERVCGLNGVYIHLISIDTADDRCFWIRRAQYIPSNTDLSLQQQRNIRIHKRMRSGSRVKWRARYHNVESRETSGKRNSRACCRGRRSRYCPTAFWRIRCQPLSCSPSREETKIAEATRSAPELWRDDQVGPRSESLVLFLNGRNGFYEFTIKN